MYPLHIILNPDWNWLRGGHPLIPISYDWYHVSYQIHHISSWYSHSNITGMPFQQSFFSPALLVKWFNRSSFLMMVKPLLLMVKSLFWMMESPCNQLITSNFGYFNPHSSHPASALPHFPPDFPGWSHHFWWNRHQERSEPWSASGAFERCVSRPPGAAASLGLWRGGAHGGCPGLGRWNKALKTTQTWGWEP